MDIIGPKSDMMIQERDRLESEVKEASLALKAFPRNEIGLTPDDVKFSPAYQEAKKRYNTAFARLRSFNASKK